jgi:F-type H+-transporting ATPase subunit a
MASDILHIKDGYFFEVPKAFWRSRFEKPSDFPTWMVRLDADFQAREADVLIDGLRDLGVPELEVSSARKAWETWQSADHRNNAWPFDAYLENQAAIAIAKANVWSKKNVPAAKDGYQAYLGSNKPPVIDWFVQIQKSPGQLAKWIELKSKTNSEAYVQSYVEDAPSWDTAKIAQYNSSLDGKIMIPQRFGTLRNAYEAESGFCLSRYMIIELVVAILCLVMFSWLAKRIGSGNAPKGKRWNFLEGMVQWVRDDVAVPAMGEHDADKFMPFLWTLFFFILGCNLMGMIPWVGAPTASFGTTIALALIVFVIGVVMGIRTFGTVGYLKNICPSLGLPWYLAFWIVPLLWCIEFVSLFIKHAVLALRLLMNMGAGHLVLLGIMGIGISASAAATSYWGGLAAIAVLGTTILSILELLVAFLQAYLFTFLAAMFIGSSMHHH